MDTFATTREHRVRVYQEQFQIPHCPIPYIYYNEWLWIDNATEADADATYTCVATTVFTNPTYRTIITNLTVALSAGMFGAKDIFQFRPKVVTHAFE